MGGHAAPLAITGVAVADVETGRMAPDRTVITQGDRIVTVGPAEEVAIPLGATRIDGAGRTLVPGLHDMHVHISPHAAGRDFDEAEALRRAREFLLVVLAGGVTTIRNMAGTPLHLALREEVRSGVTLGPRILSCGPILETRFTFPEIAEFGTLVTTPEEARAAVIAQKRAGFDFIKVYNDIDAIIYDAIIATAREIGIPVVGHVAFQKRLEGALAAKQDSIEHLRSYDFAADTRPPEEIDGARFVGWLHTTQQRIDELAERTAEAGVWNAPTMAVEHGIRTEDELSRPAQPLPEALPGWLSTELENSALEVLFSPAQREMLAEGRAARGAMVAALDRVGAGLLAGTDCPGCRLVPGRSLIRELELMVAAGLSPWRALRTATINAAAFLSDTDGGRITVGSRADMLLLDGDPFADITSLHRQVGVVAGGQWIAAGEIERRLLAA
jgi:imidazolonepropionase-like amidohydrolase